MNGQAVQALEHFPNLVTMFLARAASKCEAPFLWSKRDGEWLPVSWAQAALQVAALAEGLARLGLKPGDRVMLVSENRPEWLIADLAIMAAGCITVPTYTTNTVSDHSHILGNSDARAAIVSTQKLADTLLVAAMESADCSVLIAIDDVRWPQGGDAYRFHQWRDLVGRGGDVARLAANAEGIGRDELACIIYTSGTGGAPRGVCQHHGAILHNVAGCLDIIANDFDLGEEIFLSFLPASHAYEHSGGQHLPIGLGGQIYYAESLEKLAANIEQVRPTVMIVVPRLFEMLRARIVKAIEKAGGLSHYLLRRALELGARRAAGKGSLLDPLLDLILSATIRRKVRARFGGRVKALVSGGAPLNPQVGLFFESLGLTLLQGYGQTEAGPVVSCNRPSAGVRMTSVGPPLKDTEVRIAEDGEIMVRGENVMHGYWQNAAESARVLKDGWLATGDVGHFDEQGRILITDRKKDLIINDKGDNISPQRIEGLLTLQPEIAQAMVVGEQRPHLVALLVAEPELIAARRGDSEALHRALGEAVDRVNAQLSVIERVRRFLLAEEPFSVENAQLTPSMKIRRHVIRARYGEQLDALYPQ